MIVALSRLLVMKVSTQFFLMLCAIVFCQAQSAIAQPNPSQSPQPSRCEESTITKFMNYFEGQPDSGYVVAFQSKIGLERFSNATVAVVDRNAGKKSAIARQKVGDKVQVCLIETPSRDQSCNPDKDPRGRVYRVYNYRLKATYSGWNSNHGCGGA
jgi:hypothetical protein